MILSDIKEYSEVIDENLVRLEKAKQKSFLCERSINEKSTELWTSLESCKERVPMAKKELSRSYEHHSFTLKEDFSFFKKEFLGRGFKRFYERSYRLRSEICNFIEYSCQETFKNIAVVENGKIKEVLLTTVKRWAKQHDEYMEEITSFLNTIISIHRPDLDELKYYRVSNRL